MFIFIHLLASNGSEPLILKVITCLKKKVLLEDDLKIYYRFVSQVFAMLNESGLEIDSKVAATLFNLSPEFIFKKPIEGSHCARHYVGLLSAGPRGKDLQELINQFSLKLAESLEDKAPQAAYIDFLASISHLDILNVDSKSLR